MCFELKRSASNNSRVPNASLPLVRVSTSRKALLTVMVPGLLLPCPGVAPGTAIAVANSSTTVVAAASGPLPVPFSPTSLGQEPRGPLFAPVQTGHLLEESEPLSVSSSWSTSVERFPPTQPPTHSLRLSFLPFLSFTNHRRP